MLEYEFGEFTLVATHLQGFSGHQKWNEGLHHVAAQDVIKFVGVLVFATD